MPRTVIFVLLLFLLLSACDDDPDDKLSLTSPSELPLLQTRKGIGIFEGFNTAYSTNVRDSIYKRTDQAIANGMRIGRLQMDWTELEPVTEEYNKSKLEIELQALKSRGLQTFLLISVYDSEGLVVPGDLQNNLINSPELINRFEKLMDWVIPLLSENDGYLISIINEADNSFDENPGLSLQIKDFVSQMSDYIHQLNPQMAVTATFAHGNLDLFTNEIECIIAECDVVSWNYYGLKSIAQAPYSEVKTPQQIIDDIISMKNVSGDKLMVFQELGMSSSQYYFGSSEDIQASFYFYFFNEMKNDDQIRTANIFQMVDWSDEVIDIFLDGAFDHTVDPIFIEQYEEALRSIGLMDFETGEIKSAWDEINRWITEFNS